MNSDEYNKKEEIVDVPYYTRDLCKDNKFRFARRLIRFENISRYRRIISEMNYGKEYFQTKELKEIENMAIRILTVSYTHLTLPTNSRV